MTQGPTLFLFRAITKTKNGEVLRSAGSLSYGRLSELFKHKLEELGYPAAKYGLHIVSVQAGLQQLLLLGSWTAYSKGIGVESLKIQKIAMLS